MGDISVGYELLTNLVEFLWLTRAKQHILHEADDPIVAVAKCTNEYSRNQDFCLTQKQSKKRKKTAIKQNAHRERIQLQNCVQRYRFVTRAICKRRQGIADQVHIQRFAGQRHALRRK